MYLLPSSEAEAVVFLVRSDPKPDDRVAFAQAHRAVACPDTHDADAVPAFFEMERWMKRIALPKRVFLPSEILNGHRKSLERFPEAPVRFADHGSSSKRPARASFRTSSITRRNRPVSEKSSSISQSQAALSRS